MKIEKKEKKNITLLVDSSVYANYRKICEHEGWIISRQFEKLMENELKQRKR